MFQLCHGLWRHRCSYRVFARSINPAAVVLTKPNRLAWWCIRKACGSSICCYRAVWRRFAWYSSGCTGVLLDFKHERLLLNPYMLFVMNQQLTRAVYNLGSCKNVLKEQNMEIVIHLIQPMQAVDAWAPFGVLCVCVCVCVYVICVCI
jgi:hypothetical protein